MRSRRAACRSRCSTPAEIERRFPIRLEPGETRALPGRRRDRLRRPRAAGAARRQRTAAGADVRERLRVESIEEDGDGVVAGGLRAQVAVVTAGAWAPALVGVDATPTRETTSYFSLDEPVPSVIDERPGERTRLCARGAGDRAEGGTAPVGAGGRPGRAGRARRGDRRAGGGVGGAAVPPAPVRLVRDGDVPLHEAGRTTSSCSSARGGSSSARRAAATASSSRR